jgi:hypothetical protein
MSHPVVVAVTALHAAVTAAANAAYVLTDPDTAIRVDFGDPGAFGEPSAIGIAIATEETEAVGGAVAPWMGSDTVTYDVLCAAKAWQGLDDQDGRISRIGRAFALLDLVRAQLGGVLETCRGSGVVALSVARESYVPVVDDREFPGALVQFVVRVVATRPG